MKAPGGMRGWALAVPAACLLGLAALAAGRRTLPAPEESEGKQLFRRTVVDMLNRNCTVACHGVAASEIARKPGALLYPVDPATGLIESPEQVEAAYRACTEPVPRPHAAPRLRVDPRQPAKFSPVARMALSRVYSGAAHPGGDVFASPAEADYRTLLAWVEAEVATRARAPELESPARARFRSAVMPVLLKKGCAGANCHGPQAFNDLKLDPGVGPGERFSSVLADLNRVKMLGAATPGGELEDKIGKGAALASLSDVRTSKLLLKDIPLSAGGILHKGGNNFFVSRDDPDFRALVEWLELEKGEATAAAAQASGAPALEPGCVRGLVFVRARIGPGRRWWDVDAFRSGSRLMLLPIRQGETLAGARGPAVDLTPALGLTGEEEIRSPAVSYDGQRVLFAMRRTAADRFNVYEIELDGALVSRPPRRLTFGPADVNGLPVHFVDPCYLPDPDDAERKDLRRVAYGFASNLAGAVTPSMPRGIPGEADGGTCSTIRDLERHERPGTFQGHRVWFLAGTNAGRWARIVGHDPGPARGEPAVLHFEPPLPDPVDASSVYAIEPDPGDLPGLMPSYDIYRARYPAAGDERATFARTASRLTFTSDQDRGPVMRSSGEIMFTSLRALQYRDGKPVYNGGIFRVVPGGSDFHQHQMNRSGYLLAVDDHELPCGLEVRVAMDPRNLWGGGSLLLADHQFGPDLEPGNPVDAVVAPFGARPRAEPGPGPEPPSAVRATVPGSGGLAVPHSTFRFLRAAVPLRPELGPQGITPTGQSPGGFFRDPHPMPDNTIVVAHDPRPVDHLDPAAAPDPDLYVLAPRVSYHVPAGDRAGDVVLTRIAAASAPGVADLYPRPLVARFKEPVLRDVYEADRAGPPREVRGFEGHPEGTPAYLECYDFHTLDMLLAELAPVGARQARPRTADRALEQPRSVRVVAVPPASPDRVRPVPAGEVANRDPASTTVSNGIHTPRAIVAEVPLEADGSFYLEVPPAVPFVTQAVNADGMALRTLDKLAYAVPGERFRMSVPRPMYPMICAGCHGSVSGAGTDVLRRPDALSSASRVAATWDPVRHERRAPTNAGASRGPWRSVDFRADVQPILSARCATAACHGSGAPAARLDLSAQPTRHYTRSYESLLALAEPASGDAGRKAYVAEREAQAVRSYLIEKLTGRELMAPRVLTGDRPHPSGNPLTPAELATLIRWIDLGATFVAPAQAGVTRP